MRTMNRIISKSQFIMRSALSLADSPLVWLGLVQFGEWIAKVLCLVIGGTHLSVSACFSYQHFFIANQKQWLLPYLCCSARHQITKQHEIHLTTAFILMLVSSSNDSHFFHSLFLLTRRKISSREDLKSWLAIHFHVARFPLRKVGSIHRWNVFVSDETDNKTKVAVKWYECKVIAIICVHVLVLVLVDVVSAWKTIPVRGAVTQI